MSHDKTPWPVPPNPRSRRIVRPEPEPVCIEAGKAGRAKVNGRAVPRE